MSNKKLLQRANEILQPVDSSNVTRIGYDAENLNLFVEFHGGRIYLHRNVPETAWNTLAKAPSKGTCYNEVFKGNADFPFERLDKNGKKAKKK